MTYYPPISPYRSGLKGTCPRCGYGKLFDGFLTTQKNCRACRLDFSKGDAGDGPAVFAIFIVGFSAIVVAFMIRFTMDAPILIAFLLSTLFACVLTALILRPLKATLIALQYVHQAQEGKQTNLTPPAKSEE